MRMPNSQILIVSLCWITSRLHEHGTIRIDEVLVVCESYVFWFGDLNYRLEESVSYEVAVKAIEANQLDALRKHDQASQMNYEHGSVMDG